MIYNNEMIMKNKLTSFSHSKN